MRSLFTMPDISRRQVLQTGLATAGAGLLQACAGTNPPPPTTKQPTNPNPVRPINHGGNNVGLRLFAPAGFLSDANQSNLAISRLNAAGFQVANPEVIYRRYLRFAGTDSQRSNDLQEVAMGHVATPKVLLACRGGYGSIRLLPHIDFDRLGARMQEAGTLMIGYSDISAIQLALLAKSKTPSFAGPMLYSEFGRNTLDIYSMQSFIEATTQTSNTLSISSMQSRSANINGTFWGGNLTVLASLVGTDYMPNISGGILFIEDVNEQPYQIERHLQSLHLAGILKNQQAIVLGNFNMGRIQDVYDSSYNLSSVANTISQVAKIPVFTDFPFGHITSKTTMPLGAQASLRPMSSGGYSITFSHYPTLNANQLALNNLLPPPPPVIPVDEGISLEGFM